MKINTYAKHNSFKNFKSKNSLSVDGAVKKILKAKNNIKILTNLSKDHQKILDRALYDLSAKNKKNSFNLSQNVLDEINTLPEASLLKYIVHRFRYEIFPQTKEVDNFPPYLQIEPSSICNFRCVFCFETDNTFTNKKNGFMGRMTYDLFKKIIDDVEGKVEFISLASRGEPLACKDIEKMLNYTTGKFLNLKINTNASMLNEAKCHAILKGGVKTIVFSADAADEKLYAKLRVNGKLSQVLKNIEKFQKIRETQYSSNPIITRVSGVKFSNEQNFDDMNNLWNGLVDQVAFVDYNPWENSYQKEANDLKEPCSDLWRRMFVWWDGKTNPCDVDYKSNLSVGMFPDKKLSSIWKSDGYKKLREIHIKNQRVKLTPCRSCTVV
jgi:wyosine [tRNA(Phe)-imidazoG37] synthetase (radical SAM superfamily)